MISGIYQIRNIVSGKKYIGSSKDIHKRKLEHFRKLSQNKHENPHLQRAYNKYGVDSFTFEILLECSEDELLDNEQSYFDDYQSNWESLYNISITAGNGMKGRKHTEETKRLFSTIRRGVGNSFYGKTHTEETREKIARARTGTHPSQETLEKFSKMRSGENNPFYGKRPEKAIEGAIIANSKCVRMLDPVTKSPIREFNSLTEASKFIDGDISHISRACRFNRLAYKYAWEMVN